MKRMEKYMTHTLGNRFLEARIESKGAELSGMRSVKSGIEYIWRADPAYWGSHAPVLFPIVGTLKNGCYSYGGRIYQLGRHGFARRREFALVRKTEDSLLFSLKSDEETLKVFPFAFELCIRYTLRDAALETRYEVKNTGDRRMYFSIGAHPGFNCPLLPGEDMRDCYLEFETGETADTMILRDGLISRDRAPCLRNSRTLPLSAELFAGDALILKGLKSEKISIKSGKNGHSVSLAFKGFPYLGIWSKPGGAPFVCLEPWFGIADSVDATGRLEDKEGIIALDPCREFGCAYVIEAG